MNLGLELALVLNEPWLQKKAAPLSESPLYTWDYRLTLKGPSTYKSCQAPTHSQLTLEQMSWE